MANIAIFKTGKQPRYIQSTDPSPYMVDPTALEGNVVSNDTDVLINPDISSVRLTPVKYWKRSGNAIVEMTQAEKDAVTSTELQARKDGADIFVTDPVAIFTALIKVINLRLSVGQKITKAELITAIKAEIT